MSLVKTTLKETDRGMVLAEERTDLAIQRTVIASERTLMAWIRTALSMIGFGFSIYKFFQYLPEDIAAGNISRPQAPRNLGMSLIALGTLALSAAAWQHRGFLNEILLRGSAFCHSHWSDHVLRRSTAQGAVLSDPRDPRESQLT
jgi:uncharacterized membrane protein YidH (DUF202 family)